MAITKNPLAVIALKKSSTPKTITFKNGCTYRLTWPQFRYLRDSYRLFTDYTLTQLEDDLFKLENKNSSIVCAAQQLPLFCDIMKDFAVREEKPNLFHLKNDEVELMGSVDMLACIQEQQTGEYDCNYQDKVVLDVGGFEGESAVYFWKNGAKKIIIYEPVAEHFESIKRNVALNHINAEIHKAGIGKENTTVTVHYDETNPGFGIHSNGIKSVDIELSDVSEVIAESGADIAKFDCEGAEKYLVDVSAQILQKIPFYIIEVHTTGIRAEIISKFGSIGFDLKKDFPKHSCCSVLTFQLL